MLVAESDEILVSRAIVGNDTQAFGELVHRHQSRVRGWLRHLARDSALADDLAQETFIRAWQKLATFKGEGSFEAWLLTIARNQFLQNIRKSGRESKHIERLESEVQLVAETSAANELHGENPDAERYLEILGQDERDIMILVYGIGLSHAEASDVTGLALGTVKSHARRSEMKIREQFGLKGFGHA